MKLSAYLAKNRLSIQAFADGIKTTHESARRYVHGLRVPRPVMAKRIVKFCKGDVTLADIYGGG
jgi:hypothetical protein